MKYNVRLLENDCVCGSIFETGSLSEALKILEQQKTCNDKKYIILSCPEGGYISEVKQQKPSD
jgi:hypothetical protein